MDFFTAAVWAGTAGFFVFSMIKDKKKTIRALQMAKNMGVGMAGSIVSIVLLIGLVLAFFPLGRITAFIGNQSTLLATVICALVGTITLVPAFIAFPLVGSLVKSGLSVMPAVAFLTTLTMVGIVTFPLERKEFGTKFTIVRNALSFVFAIFIALIMGVML